MLRRIIEKLPFGADIRNLSADTASYGVGKMGEGVAALALIPVLTRVFSPAEYGVWDVTMTFFMLTTVAASLGLEPALAAFYFETRDSDRRKVVASTSIHFRLLSSIAIAALFFVLAPQISGIVFGTSEYSDYFRIVAAAIPFFLAANIFKQLLRLDFSPWKFNIVGVGYAIAYAGLAVFLVTMMGMRVSGVLFSILAASICFSIVGGVFAARHFSLRFSTDALKDMLRFSLPLLPALFAVWVIDFSDRYFLTRMSTLEQVGIYSVGARISSIIILFSTSFQMAWGPYALSIQHEDDARDMYSRGLFLFFCMALVGATGIVVFAGPILIVLTQPIYYEAWKVIGLLVLGTVAYGAYLIVNIGLIITKKTALTSLAITAGAGLNIVLNFFLIPRFGMMGAAAATLASYLLGFALLYRFAQKHYPIDYKPAWLAASALAAVVTMAISSVVRLDSAPADFIFRSLLFIVFIFVIGRIYLLRPDK
jgi:O-antigen/teichoic acid export membrane protein